MTTTSSVGGKEQCGDEVEDQRRDEQPEKQEQRPVRSVAPAVLHPPGDDHCQKHVHHPKRVHPVGRRTGTGLEQLAEAAHQPRHREASDNRGEDAYVAKRIHIAFRLEPTVPFPRDHCRCRMYFVSMERLWVRTQVRWRYPINSARLNALHGRLRFAYCTARTLGIFASSATGTHLAGS